MPVFAPTLFRRAILTRKVGQTGLILIYDEGSIVGLSMQGYKSPCAAITISSTLVKIQIPDTHQHTQTAL